jgi:hypothetical protein
MNFFSWNHVSPPKTDEDPIPIYGQPLEHQKSDAILNIAFNPTILEKYGKNAVNPLERDMLIKLAFEFTQNQNNVVLSKDSYEIAESFECYGNQKVHIEKFQKLLKRNNNDVVNQVFDAIDSESVPDNPDKLINKFLNIDLDKNIGSKDNTAKQVKNLIQELNPSTQSNQRPKYETKIITKNQSEILEIRIFLDQVQSMSECCLSIGTDQTVILDTKGLYDILYVSLGQFKSAYHVDTENIDAKFVRNKCILKILLNLKKINTLN